MARGACSAARPGTPPNTTTATHAPAAIFTKTVGFNAGRSGEQKAKHPSRPRQSTLPKITAKA